MNAPAQGMRSLELGGTSFYCRDGLLELWLAVMVDELDGDEYPWARQLRETLRTQATVVFNGLVTANLDQHLFDEARREKFRQACCSARERLTGDGFIPGTMAAEIGASRWNAEMPARLTRIADSVLWLLEHADEAS